MIPSLPYGCFTAEVLNRRNVAGLVLTETAYPENLKLPKHSHEHACFSVVLQGSFNERVGNRTRTCLPSSVIFLPSGEVHSDHFLNKGGRCLHMEIGAQWLERLADHTTTLQSSSDFCGGLISSLAARLYHEFSASDDVSLLAIEGLALEVIAETSRRVRRVSAHDSQRWLGHAREYLDAHFSERVSLAGMAEQVGVHPIHLAREFHKHYRCTVGDYVRKLRIEYACGELSESDKSLAEIASAAGFADQSHFSRVFKRFTSMTPAKYRAAFTTC